MTFPLTRAISATLAALTATAALAGCTVKKTEAPPLSGPSELALSLQTTATPDILGQDGLSQSQVQIVARGPDGRPARAVPMRVEILASGLLVDYGRLSARNVVTGDDGIARLTYTAPPALAEPVDNYTVITLLITPISGDYANANARSVDIRLVPNGPIIIPPNGAPIPAFIITPTPVTAFTPVTFDASSSRDEGGPCGSACRYSWDFGDGSAATGIVVSHEFRSASTFTVRLTVTDLRGQSSTLAQAISVVASDKPKPDFVFSPTAPKAGQDIFFNAAASTAAPGRKIVAYDWDFGSGRSGTGMTVAKRYDTPATYSVTLTVSDDTFSPGGTAVVTKSVTVAVP